jgi:hypothetical protein
MVLAFYGALHTGSSVYVLSRGGTMGTGSILSAVFFILTMFLLLKEIRNVQRA